MYVIKAQPEDFTVVEQPIGFSGQGPYGIYLLKKREWTTEAALKKVADLLHCKRSSLGYAGLKDKKAVTTQYISVFNKHNANLETKDIDMVYRGRNDEPLRLGDLQGNQFTIVVRNLDEQDVQGCKERVRLLKSWDWKLNNYFDEQRFSENNAEIGKLLVKKAFGEAIAVLVKKSGIYERTIQAYIDEHPGNFIGALRTLPKTILFLYVHAYQSLLFNELLAFHTSAKVSISPDTLKGSLFFGPIEKQTLPLIGFETEDADTITNLLQKEGISIRDFIFQQIPELTSSGNERNTQIVVKEFSVTEPETDELYQNKQKVTVQFTLPPGAYATMLVKFLFIPPII